jgi:hypothetical protein
MAEQAYHNPQSMNARVRVAHFALFTARNIAKRDLEARGVKLSHINPGEITQAAHRLLAERPELLEQAAEHPVVRSYLLRFAKKAKR